MEFHDQVIFIAGVRYTTRAAIVGGKAYFIDPLNGWECSLTLEAWRYYCQGGILKPLYPKADLGQPQSVVEPHVTDGFRQQIKKRRIHVRYNR